MKKAYNLAISESIAETIKIKIGSAKPLDQEETMEVCGKDLYVPRPRKVNITSEEIREVLKEPVRMIIDAIKVTLENTPPALHADLIYNGITLCGGGALLRNIDRAISEEIEIPAKVTEDPMRCVVRGAGVIVENLNSFKDALESGEDVL
jgi:rod shape-determining protein MreB